MQPASLDPLAGLQRGGGQVQETWCAYSQPGSTFRIRRPSSAVVSSGAVPVNTVNTRLNLNVAVRPAAK